MSSKLLLLTVAFVMISEVLIFVPSIANFRNTWLRDKLAVAGVAATVMTEAKVLSPELKQELLQTTGATAIAYTEGNTRYLIARDAETGPVTGTINMSSVTPWEAIHCSFGTLFGLKSGSVRVIGAVGMGEGRTVDMIIPVSYMRKDLLDYSFNILQLSLVISVLTATLVFLALRWLFLRPMQQIFQSMGAFAREPENARTFLKPSDRSDELGEAERQLANMQRSLNQALHQQRRMADLGLAVSKINHDMRNLLASAQLFLERLEGLPDPTVQRVAPKILATLDRAARYTSAVLSYGKAQEAPPQLRLVRLHNLVNDVSEVQGLNANDDVQLENKIATDLELEVDPEQFFRVLQNLCRNAEQALAGDKDASVVKRITFEAQTGGEQIRLTVTDTGPGVPEKQHASLFKAFQSSGKVGGTGLGLAIAAEIVRAHGGEIKLNTENAVGACFEIFLPYRHIEKSSEQVTRLFPVERRERG
ncbi:ATP-binding protein [Pseudovibrio flavus]|uniref:ATP-binding protein n=1 Tax=Pseudovibrio flavus TaxID=2529854 RepID=UPI00211C71B2|nr:HAMP domain-containing sensor histidine kinase [Pseudovibrio flavus]